MNISHAFRFLTALIFGLGLLGAGAAAAETYKPFVLADPAGDTVQTAADNVAERLKAAGLEVLGRYQPYPDGSAVIFGVTSDSLRKAAGSDPYGGFGAVVRVAVTDNAGDIEVTYVNPVYMGYAYHIGDLSGPAEEFSSALGNRGTFGAQGLSAEELEKYHYMMFMPYFKDRRVIARFGSHDEALSKVMKALDDRQSDMSPVWTLTLDEKQTLVGVSLDRGVWADGRIAEIMQKIDTGTPRSTASLPWELLISGDELVYLPGKYRIAVMFPDLTMGTFMQISDVPDDMAASAAELHDILQRL
ncbi:MAG: hypothetical protein PVF91_11360 [Chromatiales bacterium]|jgi:hypothetical protein